MAIRAWWDTSRKCFLWKAIRSSRIAVRQRELRPPSNKPCFGLGLEQFSSHLSRRVKWLMVWWKWSWDILATPVVAQALWRSEAIANHLRILLRKTNIGSAQNATTDMVPGSETLKPNGDLSATGEELHPHNTNGCPDRSYCAAGLNPKGCSDADSTNVRNIRESFKKKTTSRKIGTWNVCSMYQGKLHVVKKKKRRWKGFESKL